MPTNEDKNKNEDPTSTSGDTVRDHNTGLNLPPTNLQGFGMGMVLDNDVVFVTIHATKCQSRTGLIALQYTKCQSRTKLVAIHGTKSESRTKLVTICGTKF